VKDIIQIIDISASIMYDKEQAQNAFLSLVNACISHELRNPLNSIIAQNIEKSSLYQELKLILASPNPNIHNCNKIIAELEQGLKVQGSSADVMGFIVQDMLDYA
jgi:signal transduction histidine kinase